jgi:hypothetical protein
MDRPYILKGVIEQDFGAVTLTVQSLELFDEARQKTG